CALPRPLGVQRERVPAAGGPPRLQESGERPARTLRGARPPPAQPRRGVLGRALKTFFDSRDGAPNRVQDRNASAWLLPSSQERAGHALRADMNRYDPGEMVDVAIVGCGAGGATAAQRLARAGWSVVALDAGPFWDPDADWVSDEAGSHHLYWNEPRLISGDHP